MRAILLLATLLYGCGMGRGGSRSNGDDNLSPIAHAGIDRQGAPGESLSFDGSASTDPDGTIASYTWSFGDSSIGADGTIVAHTFATAGIYSVVLTVTDDASATASDGVTVEIAEAGPVARLTVSSTSSVDVGVPLGFDASASTDSIVAYRWSFGDSSAPATGAVVQHTYAFAGSFKVSVEVEDDSARTATDYTWVTVTDGGGGGGLTIANVQGVYDIVADPAMRNCLSYSVSVLDTIITLGGGAGSTGCSSGEEAAAATGASGNPYSGCMSGGDISLSYDGPSAVQASSSCATTLTFTMSLSFDTTDHFTGTATSFYDAALGCTCSAIFTLEGTRR